MLPSLRRKRCRFFLNAYGIEPRPLRCKGDDDPFCRDGLRPAGVDGELGRLMNTVGLVGRVIPIAAVLGVNRWSRSRTAATTF